MRYAELNKSLIDKIKDLEGQLLSIQAPLIIPPGGASAEEVSKLKKDLDKAKIEAKQARNQEKLKCDYLERECQQLKEKYDALKHHSIQFELAS